MQKIMMNFIPLATLHSFHVYAVDQINRNRHQRNTLQQQHRHRMMLQILMQLLSSYFGNDRFRYITGIVVFMCFACRQVSGQSFHAKLLSCLYTFRRYYVLWHIMKFKKFSSRKGRVSMVYGSIYFSVHVCWCKEKTSKNLVNLKSNFFCIM